MSTATEILARMVEAKRAMDALPPIQTEQRMHPDDINELRDRFRHEKSTGPFNNIFGIKIIPDETAERLPRIHLTPPDKPSHKFKGLEADAMWMDEVGDVQKQPVAQKNSTA